MRKKAPLCHCTKLIKPGGHPPLPPLPGLEERPREARTGFPHSPASSPGRPGLSEDPPHTTHGLIHQPLPVRPLRQPQDTVYAGKCFLLLYRVHLTYQPPFYGLGLFFFF